jgi:putative lipoprotein
MSPRLLPNALLAVVAFVVSTLGPWQPPVFASNAWKGRITGTAIYRERVALSPAAVFDAALEEETQTEVTGKVIAKVRRENPGQVPIAFEIAYDPRRIDPRRTYLVRASIHEHGRLRFTGTEVVAVLTHGHGRKVTVLMHGAPRDSGAREKGRGAVAELGNTRWRPVQIGDRDVVVSGREREPWIELDPRSMRVTGSGGCNRIAGSYDAGNGTLRFGRLVSTQMACISGMDTETAFLRALRETRGYRVRGRILELKDDRGLFLVRLEERNVR